MAAGSGKYGTNNRNYYLYKTTDYWYWTLSPSYYNETGAYVFRVNNNGNLGYSYVNNSGAIAPVINLSANYVKNMVGTGIMTDPYRDE